MLSQVNKNVLHPFHILVTTLHFALYYIPVIRHLVRRLSVRDPS